MPRRISDYPDAFTGWNFISSIGSLISVAATALFLHIVYLQLVKGKAIFGYPWAVPQLFSDYLRILKDKCAPGLEWALHNPPKPHAFTSLPLQSTNPSQSVPLGTLLCGFAGLSSLLLTYFFDLGVISCDAPRAWGLYFQDSASPQMEALVELHDNIMYYLVAILFSVGWIQGAIIRNFDSSRSPISNKFLNHGINVPIQKYSKFSEIKPLNHKTLLPVRTYSTWTNKEQDKYNTQKLNLNKDSINPLVYVNAYSMKKTILKENTGKSGIYMLTNLLTGDMYIGQSTDLSKRFRKYFTISYIKSRKELIISRALIKYGYANFSVSILEYCDRCDLTVREQHYLDKFKPQYNILKIAGSSLGFKQSEETKLKISKALKGVYTGDKSALFGSFHTEETKKRMSLSKAGENNPLFGKIHSEDTKKLMSQRALNRKHSCETKDKMSKTHGNPVNIYEKSSSKGFELIGSFVSPRRAAKFLDISGSTVIKYMQSGAIYKDRYKFSSASQLQSSKRTP